MPEHTKEKDMERLRHLAGVLRQAVSDATTPAPTTKKKTLTTQRTRTPPARSTNKPASRS